MDEIHVSRVLYGLSFCGVQISTGHMGLCHSLLNEIEVRCCKIFDKSGSFSGSHALDVAELSLSADVGEGVVGVACLNALSQIVMEKHRDSFTLFKGNLIDYIAGRAGKQDVVALIGHIKPLAEKIKGKVKELLIFERNPLERNENILPEEVMKEELPRADIVVATGSTIPNKTIDLILNLATGARLTCLIGPSAGLVPNPLFKRGVKAIGTIRVLKPSEVFRILGEGGGTPHIKPYVEFINLFPKKNK